MGTDRSSGDMRLWHPAAAFDIEAHQPYFGEEAWGACFASHVYGLPATVHAHVRVTPEGLLLHADCERCSQRHEVALDFRSLDESCFGAEAPEVDLAAFGGERVRSLQLALWQESLRTWADGHRECLRLQGEPVFEPHLAEALREVLQRAGTELRERGWASSCVVLTAEDERAVWFDANGARELERTLTAFRVREITDRARPAAFAVVAVEEVGAPEGATVLRLAVLTETQNWMGLAEIDRFDRPAPGRGILQEPSWSPIQAGATWLDGLRARRRFFPVPRVLAPAQG